jgi:hypothetical protein
VILFEDVKADPAGVLGGVERFLGLRPLETYRALHEPHNAAMVPRNVRLARFSRRFGQILRSVGAGNVVMRARKSLLMQTILFRPESSRGNVPEEEVWRRLAESYEEDIAFVERLVDRELAAWRAYPFIARG